MGYYTGDTQTPDIEEALERVRYWLLQGRKVNVIPREFSGLRGKEHPNKIEYEVYVYQDVNRE